MTRIQTLFAAIGKLPAYDLKAMTLYQKRHTHTPTEVERKQALKSKQKERANE